MKTKRIGGHRLELDLLRLFAIVGVVFIHSFYEWDAATEALSRSLQGIFSLSVVVFFYISGILSDPSSSRTFQRRFDRVASLLLVWISWGCLYIIVGVVAKGYGLIASDREIFRPDYPFFVFSYQLYFLLALSLFSVIQACWLWFANLFEFSGWLQLTCEMCLSVLLLSWISLSGWPSQPHGDFLYLYPTYALSYLLGVLQSRSLSWAFLFSTCVAIASHLSSSVPLTAIFLVLAPLLLSLLRAVVYRLSPSVVTLLAFLSGCSGAVFLLHHPIILPLSRRFWRIWDVPDWLNYALSISLACLLPILLVLALRPWLLRWTWLSRLLLVRPQVLLLLS